MGIESQTMERKMFMLETKSEGSSVHIHEPVPVTFEMNEDDGIEDKLFFVNIQRGTKWSSENVKEIKVVILMFCIYIIRSFFKIRY